MNSIPLYKNEIIKCVKAPFSWLLLGIPIIPSLFVFVFIYFMPYQEFLDRINSTDNDPDPFNYFFKWFRFLFGITLIPYYSIFLTWFFEIERKAKGWKYLFSCPVRFLNILFSKLAVAMGFIASSLLLSSLILFFIVGCLKSCKTDWHFMDYKMIEMELIMAVFGSIFISSLPAFLILFVLIMLFDNPGFIIILSSIVALYSSWYNPFHFHIFALDLYKQLRFAWNVDFILYLIPITISTVIIISIIYFKAELKKFILKV